MADNGAGNSRKGRHCAIDELFHVTPKFTDVVQCLSFVEIEQELDHFHQVRCKTAPNRHYHWMHLARNIKSWTAYKIDPQGVSVSITSGEVLKNEFWRTLKKYHYRSDYPPKPLELINVSSEQMSLSLSTDSQTIAL